MNTVRILNLKVNVNLYSATQPSKYEPSMYGSYFNPKAWIVVHYFTVSTESLVVMTQGLKLWVMVEQVIPSYTLVA